jgi:hypothetical protein
MKNQNYFDGPWQGFKRFKNYIDLKIMNFEFAFLFSKLSKFFQFCLSLTLHFYFEFISLHEIFIYFSFASFSKIIWIYLFTCFFFFIVMKMGNLLTSKFQYFLFLFICFLYYIYSLKDHFCFIRLQKPFVFKKDSTF